MNTAEETTFPATIFGDHVAFNIGSGDGKRIALASLGDGRVVRRYKSRSAAGLSASPDGKTLYYSFAGGIWAQPVDGGEPTRIADGEDVVVDPTGQHLYVKRSRNGAVTMFRLSIRGTDAEELPMPPGYQLGFPPLSPAAVDPRGRGCGAMPCTSCDRTATLPWSIPEAARRGSRPILTGAASRRPRRSTAFNGKAR